MSCYRYEQLKSGNVIRCRHIAAGPDHSGCIEAAFAKPPSDVDLAEAREYMKTLLPKGAGIESMVQVTPEDVRAARRLLESVMGMGRN